MRQPRATHEPRTPVQVLDVFVEGEPWLFESPVVAPYSPRHFFFRPSGLEVSHPDFAAGALVLIAAPALGDPAALGRLTALRRHHPHVVIYFCAHIGGEEHRPPASQAYVPADRLFILERATEWAALQLVLQARSRVPLPVAELQGLCHDGTLTSGARRIVLRILRAAHRPVQPAEIAAHAGRALRTVEHDMQREGLPVVRDIARAGRALHLLALLRRGVRRASEHADLLGFSTSTELRQFKWRLRQRAMRDWRLHDFIARFRTLDGVLGEQRDDAW